MPYKYKKVVELNLKGGNDIYAELAKELAPYRESPPGSYLFIVEGTRKRPIVGIRYPGKKVRRRTLKRIASNSALWANLYDFEVVPFRNGKELSTIEFTFEKLMRDFQKHKRENEKFWKILEELYRESTISKTPPKLSGIDPLFYLQILKWIWIQEDLNYRFHWEEIKSPVRYVLETRTGSRTSRGAGRAKFFAALILLKNYFDFDQVKKIIPLY